MYMYSFLVAAGVGATNLIFISRVLLASTSPSSTSGTYSRSLVRVNLNIALLLPLLMSLRLSVVDISMLSSANENLRLRRETYSATGTTFPVAVISNTYFSLRMYLRVERTSPIVSRQSTTSNPASLQLLMICVFW